MPAGRKLATLRQFVRLIGIHPSASGGDGTGTVGTRSGKVSPGANSRKSQPRVLPPERSGRFAKRLRSGGNLPSGRRRASGRRGSRGPGGRPPGRHPGAGPRGFGSRQKTRRPAGRDPPEVDYLCSSKIKTARADFWSGARNQRPPRVVGFFRAAAGTSASPDGMRRALRRALCTRDRVGPAGFSALTESVRHLAAFT